MCAQGGEPRRRLGFGRDPVVAENAGEQHDRLALTEYLDAHQRGPVQSAEASPTGDQRQAFRAVGQQRPDLIGVGRVVQHHEYAPADKKVPIGVDRIRELRGHLLRR
jgi:hypothetical protein